MFVYPFSTMAKGQAGLDSLLALLKKDKADTIKANHFEKISTEYFYSGNPALAKQYADSLLILSQKLNYRLGMAKAYSHYGNIYLKQGAHNKALTFYKKAMEIYTAMKNKQGIATVTGSIGNIYSQTSDFAKALQYYTNAINLCRQINDKDGIATYTNDIGIIYAEQGDNPKSLEYFLKALQIDRELGDKRNIARATGNMGVIYTREGDNKRALASYMEALKTSKEMGDKSGIATNASNIGESYNNLGKYTEALKYLQQALQVADETGNKYLQATTFSNIGDSYQGINKNDTSYLAYFYKALKITFETGNKDIRASILAKIGEGYLNLKEYNKAQSYLRLALATSLSVGNLRVSAGIYRSLSRDYSETGDWKNAYKMYVNNTNLKDSLWSEEKTKEIGRLEAKADFDKQLAIQKADENQKAAIDKAERKRQQIFIFFIAAIAFAAAIIAIIIFRSLKITRTQKKLIELQKMAVEQQKLLVEEKNTEIVDSINYAKRLQDAILPPIQQIKQYFPESFVLYKPKDIVAGDFYWVAHPQPFPMGREKEQNDGDAQIASPYLTADPMTYEPLKEFAEKHRNYPTEAESVVWELLKSKKLEGYKFRRQHIIGQYAADFVCLKKKLVIEIDGLIHQLPDVKDNDEVRTRWLNDKGYAIIRFSNEEVFGNTENMLQKIITVLKSLPDVNTHVQRAVQVLPTGEDLGGAAFIAACDCTGHGVPGALVSVVCSNALNRAVKEFGLTDPGKILDKTRELVLETFGKSEGEIKDGMDISLASLNPSEGGMQIQWAGAFNPLLYVENGEMKEIKGDKQPIGKTDNPKPFTTHTITFSHHRGDKGGLLYLFTDGFTDQFGGPKGKKFKYKQLQDTLLAVSKASMQEQKERLEETFANWMGMLEQVDDVLVIGIRV